MEIDDKEVLSIVAARVIGELSIEKKTQLIENAFVKVLNEYNVSWAIKKPLEEEATKIAGQVVTNPEFQQRIRYRAMVVLEEAMDKVMVALGITMVRAFRGVDKYPNNLLGKMLDQVEKDKGVTK